MREKNKVGENFRLPVYRGLFVFQTLECAYTFHTSCMCALRMHAVSEYCNTFLE